MHDVTTARVSVIVPAYNCEKTIRETIASAMAQEYPDMEWLVVDDESQDRTGAILEEIGRTSDRRCEVIRHPSNRGVSASRNTGLRHATGEFVAFLDSDDVWLQGYLKTMIALLKETKAHIAVAPAVTIGESAGDLVGATPEHVAMFPDFLYAKNFILPSCVVMRREVWEMIGGFDEDPSIQHAEDWDYWLRALDAGLRFVFARDTLVQYRIHPGNASGREIFMLHQTSYCLEKALQLRHLNHRLIRKSLARNYLKLASLPGVSESGKAFQLVISAWKFWPWSYRNLSEGFLLLRQKFQARSDPSR